MDIIRLLKDYGIDHITEGNKHCSPGWVQVHCPFCTGSKSYHLGWNINEEFWHCWRCGWKSPTKALAELLKIQPYEIPEILKRYGINRTVIQQKIVEKKPLKLPSGLSYLKSSHKKYLIERGFNPDELAEKWMIQGTGPVSRLDNVSYRFRIFIPFYWNAEIVSFDSRDITGKQQNKYQACPAYYETIGHKQILYGDQENWNPELGICVEGPTDVWRLGQQAFATSGIQYTRNQVRVMSSIFKRIAVVYDDDPQAQVQAKKLVAELRFRGVDAWNVSITGDPGSLTNKKAKELLNYIKNH